MTREEARKLLPMIQAYAEGKAVQYWNGHEWAVPGTPNFESNPATWRIKPEPREFWAWLEPTSANYAGILYANRDFVSDGRPGKIIRVREVLDETAAEPATEEGLKCPKCGGKLDALECVSLSGWDAFTCQPCAMSYTRSYLESHQSQ